MILDEDLIASLATDARLLRLHARKVYEAQESDKVLKALKCILSLAEAMQWYVRRAAHTEEPTPEKGDGT